MWAYWYDNFFQSILANNNIDMLHLQFHYNDRHLNMAMIRKDLHMTRIIYESWVVFDKETFVKKIKEMTS